MTPVLFRFVALLGFAVVVAAQPLRAQECPAGGATDRQEFEYGEMMPYGDYPLALYRRIHGLGMPDLQSGETEGDRADEWIGEARKLGVTVAAATLKDRGTCNYPLAAEFLRQRVDRLGPGHPYVRDWLANQETVFRNCRGGATGLVLPTLSSYAGADARDMAAQDFAYQTAAALYYSKHFEEARHHFAEIAADVSSPFGPLAQYMVLRAYQGEGEYGQYYQLLSDLRSRPMTRALPMPDSVIDFLAYYTDDPRLLVEQLRRKMELLLRDASTIDADPAATTKFWAAAEDLQWFLHSNDRRFTWVGSGSDDDAIVDDWWLGDEPLPGHPRGEAVRSLARESAAVDWLQAMRMSGRYYGDASWLTAANRPLLRAGYDRATAHTLQRWRRGDGIEWAVAAMARLEPDQPEKEDLLRFFDELSSRARSCALSNGESASLQHLFYHAVRLRLTGGQVDRATALLLDNRDVSGWHIGAALLESLRYLVGTGDLTSARKLLRGFVGHPALNEWEGRNLRQLLARDLQEFLATAGESKPYLDPGSIAILNLLPVRLLSEVAESSQLGDADRAAVARVAWTRAYFLNRQDVLASVTPTLLRLNPALGPFLDDIAAAHSLRHRDHMITYMMLRNPRLGPRLNSRGLWEDDQADQSSEHILQAIDTRAHSDDNWWCRFDRRRYLGTLSTDLFGAVVGPVNIEDAYDRGWYRHHVNDTLQAYLDATQEMWPPGNSRLVDRVIAAYPRTLPILRLIDWAELAELAKIPNGAQFLSERTIAWARTSTPFDRWIGRDELLPESLHLSVRTTRYGCQRDGGHGRYSRQAFMLLHRRFLDDPWTKQTPYWFDCAHFSWGMSECRTR